MQATILQDGRLHLNDGPIDLIIGADGDGAAVRRAREAAVARFATALDELCAELPLLRSAVLPDGATPSGTIARRMWAATRAVCAGRFITPMAAVAGAVADEILAAMLAAATLRRAYVNNGGDIALHLADCETYEIGLIDRPDRPGLLGSARIASDAHVRGVATSGWRGRSFSLGIADAVTVLARSAAEADAAATLVANAVDLPGHRAVARAPACDFDPQSDLGARMVTRDVDPLEPDEIDSALGAGLREARRLIAQGRIAAAALHLQGFTRTAGGVLSGRQMQATGISGAIAHASC
jgi:uncharacterized protein